MSSEKYIKKGNRKILIGYLLINFIYFSIISESIKIDFSNLKAIWGEIIDIKYLMLLIFYISTIILEAIMSAKLKHIIIFWKIKNTLPGTRAFSVIAKNDKRIDMAALKNIFNGELPEDPDDQNTKWFKLYRKYSSKPIVFEAHRMFLLTRDLVALTLILIPVFIIEYFLYNTPWAVFQKHIVFLFVIAGLGIIACRNYGNGFVANVLVEASHNK